MKISEINKHTGQDILLCYQCQKCTATCPVSNFMDIKPDVVVRMSINGKLDNLMRSRTIWVCTGCETCGSRCPNLISVGKINEFMRQLAYENKISPAVKPALDIHLAFLNSIKRFGIVHEASMLAEFKLRTKDFLSDLKLGLKMFLKGKIPIKPHTIKGINEIKRIFEEK
ncbi:MAG: 4Fe-4S dicluster domain-containing protein [Proteobacteria bacterium]|nr:4Fe-4S dicluster domain-containing protein [Pseudomonadota bacterium]